MRDAALWRRARSAGERQGEDERTPELAARVEPEPAAMLFGDAPADVQTQTVPGDVARARRSEEGTEESTAFVLR
jgi:hypothetical protein